MWKIHCGEKKQLKDKLSDLGKREKSIEDTKAFLFVWKSHDKAGHNTVAESKYAGFNTFA